MITRATLALLLSAPILAGDVIPRHELLKTIVTGDNGAAVRVHFVPVSGLDRLVSLCLYPPPDLSLRIPGRLASMERMVHLTQMEAMEVAGFLLALKTGGMPRDAKVRFEAKQFSLDLVDISGRTRWRLRVGDTAPWAVVGSKLSAETLGSLIMTRVRMIRAVEKAEKEDEIETLPDDITAQIRAKQANPQPRGSEPTAEDQAPSPR